MERWWVRSLLLVLGLSYSALGATIRWIVDDIHNRLDHVGHHHYHFNTTANGLIADDEAGNIRFQLNVQYNNQLTLVGSSPCFSPNLNAEEFKAALLRGSLGYVGSAATDNIVFSNLFQVHATKYFYYNHTVSTARIAFDFSFTSIGPFHANITAMTMTSTGCAPMRTTGKWNDRTRWVGGVAPTAADTAYFPVGSGQVVVSQDITIQSLVMHGGELVLVDSSCPSSWTMDDRSTTAQKCYRLYSQSLSYSKAQDYCHFADPATRGSLGSSFDRQLVHIGDRVESDLVYRLCRSSPFSSSSSFASPVDSQAVAERGCWIGLRDPLGSGQFSWIDKRAVGKAGQASLYFDWKKGQPDNSTTSEGLPNTGGERCVSITPWTDNPLLQEQGGWIDDGCELSKPFICQSFATIRQFKVSVTANGEFSGPHTAISGGLVEIAGFANITELYLESTHLTFLSSFSTSAVFISKRLTLHDNAKVDFFSRVEIQPLAVIGETATNFQGLPLAAAGETIGAQPVITAKSTALVIFGCYTSQFCPTSLNSATSPITVRAKLQGSGKLTVQPHVVVSVLEGGDLSRMTITTMGSDSQFSVGGYASRLSSYDAFILSLAHISPVVNVVWPRPGVTPNSLRGVYKIQVSNQFGLTQQTRCLPYNLSIADLMSELNRLALISARGGVTVRQYGDQSDSSYAYGYTYRIELDAVSTDLLQTGGPLTAAIACYGLQCGDCYETEVAFEPGFSPYCLQGANFSTSNPQTCVIPPTLSISSLSSLSFCNYTGKGSLVFSSSRHRLPPITSSTIAISDGIGVVAADRVSWQRLQVIHRGTVVFAGTGWEGWESSYLLYAPSWTREREFTRELLEAPRSQVSISSLTVQDNATFVTSCPQSSFKVTAVVWNGGMIGGLGQITIRTSFTLSGATKYLSYGMQVVLANTSTSLWDVGDIYLGNGANLTVLGQWTIASTASRPITIFQSPADSLSFSDSSAGSTSRFAETSGRSWGSYYSQGLIAFPELLSGWYLNPLCGVYCLTLSQMTFAGKGVLQTRRDSSIFFYLPLNMIDQSVINVGDNGAFSLHNGGTLGNEVRVNIQPGGTIELIGGSLNMEAFCTIAGAGDLVVKAGQHNLAFSIDAHITISNGSLIWPFSRGPKQTIKFRGGLLINGTGSLQVEPYATTMVIFKEVYLKDQSIIQFPLIGIAAQPTPYDVLDAPGTFPRGNMTSVNSFIWEGGELRGNVDIYALKQLILDGEQKNISSVAKLINRGHCEWGSGDVIASNNGDFINYGTIQVRDTVKRFSGNMVYIGSDVPLSNGGDPFARQYHTWDMDYGALDYSQYIKLRTEFVSRAPNGWNASLQQEDSIFNN